MGDVKYKEFDGSAAASDVYQLLAHAKAFGALSAFLIFPGDTYSVRELGTSRQGIDTAFFSVRVQHLQEDLAAVAARIGCPSSALSHTSAVPPDLEATVAAA